jgi:hypothetical protein
VAALSQWIVTYWIALLAALSLVALGVYWYHPRFWIKLDVKEFSKDPANDTFLGKFHRQRKVWRGCVIGVVALVASLPAWGHWWVMGLNFLGLGCWGAAYFFYYFNPGLSIARKLDYVDVYYVSPNPEATPYPDRYIWRRVLAEFPDDGSDPVALLAKRKKSAAEQLEEMLKKVLWGGLIFLGLCLLAEIILILFF